MSQGLSQEQITSQQLVQQQKITQQQLLNAKLLGMSLAELEASIQSEIEENPALERSFDEEEGELSAYESEGATDDFDTSREKEERDDELERALERMESDDEPLEKEDSYSANVEERSDAVYGEVLSFRDKLEEQVGELDLTSKEKSIVEYLIGSLDDDGFLRKDTDSLVDELAIYEYIDTTPDEVERLLKLIQSFEPAGIGARSLQECLRIQIEMMEDSRLKSCMLSVVNDHFELFKRLRWDKIKVALRLNDVQLSTLKVSFQRLNPKPGLSLSEGMGGEKRGITPDFFVFSDGESNVFFEINSSNIPTLTVSSSFKSLVDSYEGRGKGELTSSERVALSYANSNIERANRYITALEQRQKSMTLTMEAIVSWQKKYFLSGEESDLRPMVLRDISEVTGLDMSTISRVSASKYAQTQWGTFPLKHFFSMEFSSEDGESLSSRTVLMALKSVVDGEDKRRPYSDEALVSEMKRRGFTIARRTVAKYRDKLGIPTSHLRKDRS